jgi:hypothetical protein
MQYSDIIMTGCRKPPGGCIRMATVGAQGRYGARHSGNLNGCRSYYIMRIDHTFV